jgi:hypothetical protein
MTNDTNRSDKKIGRKALGHRPVNKWGRKVANRKSRRAAKRNS